MAERVQRENCQKRCRTPFLDQEKVEHRENQNEYKHQPSQRNVCRTKAEKFANERFAQVNTSLKSNKAPETRPEVSRLVPLFLLLLLT